MMSAILEIVFFDLWTRYRVASVLSIINVILNQNNILFHNEKNLGILITVFYFMFNNRLKTRFRHFYFGKNFM